MEREGEREARGFSQYIYRQARRQAVSLAVTSLLSRTSIVLFNPKLMRAVCCVVPQLFIDFFLSFPPPPLLLQLFLSRVLILGLRRLIRSLHTQWADHPFHNQTLCVLPI